MSEIDPLTEHAKRIMVMMMIADGAVDDKEIAAIQQLYGEFGGDDLVAADIGKEAQLALQAGTTAAQYARHIAAELSEHQQTMLIRAAFLVATASGRLERPQQQQLAELPRALGVSEVMFRQIVASVSAQQGDA